MFSVNNILDAPGLQRCRHRDMPMMFPCFADNGHLPSTHGAFGTLGNYPNEFDSSSSCNRYAHPQSEMPNFLQTAGLATSIPHAIFEMLGVQRENNPEGEEIHRENRQELNGDSEQNPSSVSNQQTQQQRQTEPTVGDIMNHALSIITGLKETTSPNKWQQRIDCHGFQSKNIKVKVSGNELLLKAFKKEESEDGLRTMSMRKAVPLPENVDRTKIKCRFSEKGFVIIEAPGVHNKEDRNDFTKEFMALVIPRLEQMVHKVITTTREANTKKENKVRKSDEKQNEELESKPDNQTHHTPEKVEENVFDTKRSQVKDTEKQILQSSEMINDKEHLDEKQDQTGLEPDTALQSHPNMNDDTEVRTQGEDLSSAVQDADTNFTPTEAFPVEVSSEPKVEDDGDKLSSTSEDSFVLLSQLEKDHDKDLIHNNDIDGVHQKIENSMEYGKSEAGSKSFDSEKGEKFDEHRPSMNEEAIIFRLEMPSYNPESLKVNFDNSKRLLYISASKDKVGVGAEAITKVVSIDDDVDANGLQCHFRDGTLRVTAPRQIDIRDIPVKI